MAGRTARVDLRMAWVPVQRGEDDSCWVPGTPCQFGWQLGPFIPRAFLGLPIDKPSRNML